MRLETQRLVLAPWGAEELRALSTPVGWPDDELAELIELYESWLRSDPAVLGYGPWVVVEREKQAVVGSVGFVGRANEDGEIELGYGIVEEHRNRGYATEAAAALVEWALAQPGVTRVIARSAAGNRPSTRVLEKLAFSREGPDGKLVRWTCQ